MADPSTLARRQRKNVRSRFKRRSNRLFEQSDEFGKLFNSKIYVLIQSHEGEFLIYNNCDDGWPPSKSGFLASEYETPQSLAEWKNDRGTNLSKFQQRKRRILLDVNKFAIEFSAKIYLAIQCSNGYSIIYSSASRPWPPSKRQVKMLCPSAKWRGPSEFDGSPEIPIDILGSISDL